MSESSRTDERDTFPTDTEITFDASEDKQSSRKLQKWTECSDVENNTLGTTVPLYGALDDQASTSINWTPQAMFEHHEKKYNFKSTYNELEYTTPLPKASNDQLLKATRMEHEIIREGQHDEEDYDRSEEDLFSKVVRPGNKQAYYRAQKPLNRQKCERKPDKMEIHPEAVCLPEWRQAAFSKLNSNSDDSDGTIRQLTRKPKDEEKPVETQNETPQTPTLSQEINDENRELEPQLPTPEFDTTNSIPEKTPTARNKSSVQKKKDAIDYIETHSREEIKRNFISFSHDLTPRITTIAKTDQSSTEIGSNSYTDLEIASSDLESNSLGTARTRKSMVTPPNIEATEDWESETTDKLQSENTSEHSSIQSQLTPVHSLTHSHDSQDSAVSNESENLSKQASSTLNPQAEEFRFDMSKLSDVILQDPAYLRMVRKGGSQKYTKQPNASMRGRGNTVATSQRSDHTPTQSGSGVGGYNKKLDMSSPGTSSGKGKGYSESIVGPTGYSAQKRGSRKGGRYKSSKHQGYKPNFEMEQQLYALPGSQFQVLTNPNGMFYQPGPMALPQTAKGPMPQPIQMATQRPTVQPIQAMQNPQLPIPQYPGFALPTPEDTQQVPPQATQILIGPDGMPITYVPPTQSEFQPYPQQPPPGYTQLPHTEAPQQYIIPQYLPANSAPPQYGYMPFETQPNQVLYSQYPPQGIIQLQNNNAKSNMY